MGVSLESETDVRYYYNTSHSASGDTRSRNATRRRGVLSCLLVTPALKSALPTLVRVGRSLRSSSLLAWCTRFLAGKKKDRSSDQSFFVSPIRYSHWYCFKVSNHWNNIRLLLIYRFND